MPPTQFPREIAPRDIRAFPFPLFAREPFSILLLSANASISALPCTAIVPQLSTDGTILLFKIIPTPDIRQISAAISLYESLLILWNVSRIEIIRFENAEVETHIYVIFRFPNWFKLCREILHLKQILIMNLRGHYTNVSKNQENNNVVWLTCFYIQQKLNAFT